nr:MAG: NS3-like protein [Guangdong Jingmen-like virus]
MLPLAAALSCIYAAMGRGLAPTLNSLVIMIISLASIAAPELVLALSWFTTFRANNPCQEESHVQRHFTELLPTLGWLSLEYVAPIEIVLNEEDAPHQEDRKHYEKALMLSKIGRARNLLVAAIVTLVVVSLIYNPTSGILGATIIISIAVLPREQGIQVGIEEAEPTNEPEGIYRVIEHIGPWKFMRGVATISGGSIVSSLHVTGSRPVWVGNNKYEPTVIQPTADFIAWGRPPTIKPLKEDDEVVALALSPHTNTILPLRSRTARIQGNTIYKLARTSPGVSGSPLYVVEYDEEGNRICSLAGTIGRSIRAGPLHQYEIQSHLPLPSTPYETILRAKLVVQLFSHPGAGKTRMIPEYVRQLMTWSNKVYVAGPTRVVAREMLEAMGTTRWVSAMVKGFPRPHALARVIVTTHQTLLRYMLTSGLLRCRDVSYILDETHVDSAHTKVLRALVHNVVGDPKSKAACVEMTATGTDYETGAITVASGSRYPITDRVYKTNIIEAVKSYAERNGPKRIAVFVPGLTGRSGALQVAKAIRMTTKYTTIVLSRKTYEKNIKQVFKNYPTGLCVVTTSISECGANYDLDAVFDTCQQYHYLVTDAGTAGLVTPSTQAQTCQRRGRVGRRREGEYYRPASYDMLSAPVLDHPDSVTLLEANMCLIALGLQEVPCGDVVKRTLQRMQPSKDQVYRWLTEQDSETLTETMTKYTVEGARRTPDQEKAARKAMLQYFKDARWEMKEESGEEALPVPPGTYIRDDEGENVIEGANYTKAPPPYKVQTKQAVLRGTTIEVLMEEAETAVREMPAEEG